MNHTIDNLNIIDLDIQIAICIKSDKICPPCTSKCSRNWNDAVQWQWHIFVNVTEQQHMWFLNFMKLFYHLAHKTGNLLYLPHIVLNSNTYVHFPQIDFEMDPTINPYDPFNIIVHVHDQSYPDPQTMRLYYIMDVTNGIIKQAWTNQQIACDRCWRS